MKLSRMSYTSSCLKMSSASWFHRFHLTTGGRSLTVCTRYRTLTVYW